VSHYLEVAVAKASKKTKSEDTPTTYEKGDRVKRLNSDGPIGTVQKVRTETVRQSIKIDGTEPPGVTVTVLWDNGTKSHFVPDSIEKL
jgi:hypothetical protein